VDYVTAQETRPRPSKPGFSQRISADDNSHSGGCCLLGNPREVGTFPYYRGPTVFERPTDMTTETYQYRGYDIVPMWQWSSWCTGIYARRADLPVVSRSTLSTMAPEKEEAVAEAKHCIDRLLSRSN
jgi:hypothetical protein